MFRSFGETSITAVELMRVGPALPQLDNTTTKDFGASQPQCLSGSSHRTLRLQLYLKTHEIEPTFCDIRSGGLSKPHEKYDMSVALCC